MPWSWISSVTDTKIRAFIRRACLKTDLSCKRQVSRNVQQAWSLVVQKNQWILFSSKMSSWKQRSWQGSLYSYYQTSPKCAIWILRRKVFGGAKRTKIYRRKYRPTVPSFPCSHPIFWTCRKHKSSFVASTTAYTVFLSSAPCYALPLVIITFILTSNLTHS